MKRGLRYPIGRPHRRNHKLKPINTISQQINVRTLLNNVGRLIILLVIVASFGSVEWIQPNPTERSAMTTAVDDWPAAARFVAIARRASYTQLLYHSVGHDQP